MIAIDLISWATRIATDAHRGQVRYDPRGDLPYIVHPLRVAALVGAHGGSPTAVAAAILHDVLEDTPVTGEGWPSEVLALVQGCTKRSDQDRLSCMANLRAAPTEAILVKLADRYDNLTAEAHGQAYAAKKLVRESTEALLAMAIERGLGCNGLVAAVRHRTDEIANMPTHTILNLHGFGSAGAGGKADALRTAFPMADVISPDLPVDAAATQALIGSIIAQHRAAGRTVVVQGTSLGGFHALLAHATWGVPCVAINPSLTPAITLRDRLGWNTNFKTGQQFELSEAHLAGYAERTATIDAIRPDAVPLLVLIGKQDELLDHQAMIAWCAERGIQHRIYPTNHRFDLYESLLVTDQTVRTALSLVKS